MHCSSVCLSVDIVPRVTHFVISKILYDLLHTANIDIPTAINYNHTIVSSIYAMFWLCRPSWPKCVAYIDEIKLCCGWWQYVRQCWYYLAQWDEFHRRIMFLHMVFFQLILFSRLVSVSLSQSEHVGYLLPVCLNGAEPVHHHCVWHKCSTTCDMSVYKFQQVDIPTYWGIESLLYDLVWTAAPPCKLYLSCNVISSIRAIHPVKLVFYTSVCWFCYSVPWRDFTFMCLITTILQYYYYYYYSVVCLMTGPKPLPKRIPISANKLCDFEISFVNERRRVWNTQCLVWRSPLMCLHYRTRFLLLLRVAAVQAVYLLWFVCEFGICLCYFIVPSIRFWNLRKYISCYRW